MQTSLCCSPNPLDVLVEEAARTTERTERFFFLSPPQLPSQACMHVFIHSHSSSDWRRERKEGCAFYTEHKVGRNDNKTVSGGVWSDRLTDKTGPTWLLQRVSDTFGPLNWTDEEENRGRVLPKNDETRTGPDTSILVADKPRGRLALVRNQNKLK